MRKAETPWAPLRRSSVPALAKRRGSPCWHRGVCSVVASQTRLALQRIVNHTNQRAVVPATKGVSVCLESLTGRAHDQTEPRPPHQSWKQLHHTKKRTESIKWSRSNSIGLHTCLDCMVHGAATTQHHSIQRQR